MLLITTNHGTFYRYTEKALAGDASAQLFLGQSYQRGFGVEKNLDEAIKWLRKSAEQGNVYAPHILKKLEEE